MAPINIIIHFPDEGPGTPVDQVVELLDHLSMTYQPRPVKVECEWVDTVEMVSRLVQDFPRDNINWRQGRPTP